MSANFPSLDSFFSDDLSEKLTEWEGASQRKVLARHLINERRF
jgi:hypothetical protein